MRTSEHFKLKMQTKNIFPIKYITNYVAQMSTYQKIFIFKRSKRFEKHSLTARHRFLKYFNRFNIFIEGN